ncbi:short-chain dehydrogenase [Mycobacterium alsense]|uniref:Short-chain dehydrogenase n=1 Tax=Mycobacterium alsense TaxID=324058 RepID=A0ABD6NSC1_9MYCO|nr:SDR family NAD(P)-dependent oxidoreductase [Mycobacterium alsense]OBG26880.1 short-chain dehydrogenase [Mycobacterium alsense]
MAATEARNTHWSEGDVGDQGGRVAVVTGANTGIGYHTAAVLAYRGAHVVLAVRNLDKGNAALSRIVAAGGHGARKVDVTLQALDLSSLDSVRTAADALRAAYPRIDLLINNAGVMWTPKQLTADGFEMQFGTNHLGHFALTGLLLDRMLGVDGSRVVTVSSLGHRLRAAIHFDDLQWERRYDRVGAYGQSKLANLLFTYELQRRLAARPEAKTIAVAAHPGGSNTELTRHLPAIVRPAAVVLGPVLFQTAAMGALPTMRAATDPTVEGGQYYGPRGFAEQRGHPKLVRSSAQSHDEELQRRLWAVSEELTGVRFPV